jgi:hypothetical protein
MINVLYALIWFVPLWIWGDWKNWRKYYSTLLFLIIGDLLYLYLLSDYFPMWRYNPPSVDKRMGLTNTHISLSIILIKYPSTVFIYLSKFPEHNWKKKLLYFFCWVFIYITNEIIDLKLNLITYSNGWNLWWSTLFSTFIFLLLRIHFRNPILAWFLSIGFMIFLWVTFHVPSTVFR